jgi:hypothetical protein
MPRRKLANKITLFRAGGRFILPLEQNNLHAD